MFIVLRLKEADTHITSRIRTFFRGPDIVFDRVYYKGDVVYCTAEAQLHKGEIPWQYIEKSCGRLCSGFVLPLGVTVPENSRIKQYRSKHFEKLVLFNTMIKYIKKHRPEPTNSTLCLVDSDGSLSYELLRTVDMFSGINIITQKPEAYESICKIIFDNYGLSVTLYPEVDNTENTVAFSIDGDKIPTFFKGTLFCTNSTFLPDCKVIKCSSLELTTQTERLIPENTDPLTFLSAMYELSGVSELHSTVYEV